MASEAMCTSSILVRGATNTDNLAPSGYDTPSGYDNLAPSGYAVWLLQRKIITASGFY